MTTPLERYQADCLRPDFIKDPAQEQAVLALNEVYLRLVDAWENHKSKRFRRKQTEPVKGLYMWGGVGRGKTYLMDTFFEAIPFRRKKRLHFHRFMHEVHHALRERQGEKNPLESIADDFAKQAKVLCFDEFFVTDITDAMLLGGLFTALFERGVTLVTTSNIAPDGLYENGLQRQRFLPAIEQIKQHTLVLNVDGGRDFRQNHTALTERFHCPLDNNADVFLEQWLAQLTEEAIERDTKITIAGRQLAVKALGEKVAWFEFRTLCDGPRSQNDYIELAQRFDTILLANVERLGANHDDMARRFVNLIDELYDTGVKLIMTSEEPINEIYNTGGLAFAFQRTESRLQEMQTEVYLAQPKRQD